MKIIKPLTLGVLHQPYRHRGVHRLAIAALGFFALGRDDERFLVENLQWPRVLPLLPSGQPLDHVLPKAHAEVVLTGSAHAREPVEAMTVRLACGPIDKRLRVIGERAWHRRWLGVCVDDPAPFTSMPLTLERAYGGPGHDNPLGCGFLARLPWQRESTGRMPNIEYPDQPVLPGRRSLAHAGFVPQQLAHAERQRRASGTYDRRWLAEDFPGLPRDFDFALYNLTSADQQFRGRFAGGEAYRLEGLHPSQPVLSGRLPTMQVCAFVLAKDQPADALQAVPLHCDTVWFFPEVGVGLMIHRGQVAVSDSDALDIGTLMLAYDASARPRPVQHYRDVLALRLDPVQAALHAFDESQLAPERSPEAQAARAAARARQAEVRRQRRQQLLDETLAEFRQQSGLDPSAEPLPPEASEPALPELFEDDLAEGDFDLAELHARAQALAEQARREGEAHLAKLDQDRPEVPATPTPSMAEQISAAVTRAEQPVHGLPGALGSAPLPVDLADLLARAEQAAPGGMDPAQQAELRSALASLPALQRAARAAAPTPTTPSEALPDPVAVALGERALAMLRAGQSLAGRDLAGACLRGADLRGADLRQTQLERADLREARLHGANLGSAVLTAARLDGADFSDACLDDANLCASSARAASFARASMCRVRAFDAVWPDADLRATKLDGALLMRIDLAGARLDDSQLDGTVLIEAKAAGSQWRGTRWRRSVAPSADFSGACFDDAQLARSVLLDARLADSSWQGASLDTVYAGGTSDWRRSRLSRLRARKCGWRGSALNEARLDAAVLGSCDFGEADLSGCDLRGAQLYRSLFMRSRLCGADASGASFFQALCRKTDFTGCDLRSAILVQADLSEAILGDARMAGAQVDRPAGLP